VPDVLRNLSWGPPSARIAPRDDDSADSAGGAVAGRWIHQCAELAGADVPGGRAREFHVEGDLGRGRLDWNRARLRLLRAASGSGGCGRGCARRILQAGLRQVSDRWTL